MLGTLLRCDAPRAFLYAISKLTPAEPVALRAAFARGLRALAIAIADTVGPSQWGLREERSAIKSDAEAALDYLFEVRYHHSIFHCVNMIVDAQRQTRSTCTSHYSSTPRRRRACQSRSCSRSRCARRSTGPPSSRGCRRRTASRRSRRGAGGRRPPPARRRRAVRADGPAAT